jgi:hypothetical protein
VKQTPLVKAWKTEETPLFKSLRKSAEWCVRQSQSINDLNAVNKEAAALEAVARQQVKTEKTKKT